jgi:hypothetical protein
VVAREGEPSAVPGRNWEILASRALDLSDAGDWVMLANLDGDTADDEVIVENGTTVIAREGFGVPAIGSFTFTSFGTGALRIDAAGDVFWFGDWNDPDTTRDRGLFENQDLLVREGVTLTAGGQLIESISSVQENFSISPDGRYLVFEGQLEGGVDAAFLLDLEAPVAPFCFGDGFDARVTTPCPCANFGALGHGCANSLFAGGARLSATGSPNPDTITLTATDVPNALAIFLKGNGNIAAGTVFGDGVRCAGGALIRFGQQMPVGNTAVFPGSFPDTVSNVGGTPPGSGLVGYYQVFYRNAAAFCTPATFNVTSGVRIAW